MFKRLFKLIIWPVKKVVLFPIKFLLYSFIIFIVSVLYLQYKADYDVETTPLSKIEYENCIEVIENYEVTINVLANYVDGLDSYQKEFVINNLPDRFRILLEPKTISAEEFEKIKGSFKTYLQGGRLPGFNGQALFPQAASLCRKGLS
ncbi:MAG: hypothetical protein O3A48_03575 [Actinomycetota bacterium]|nr:hypothetical protein [Actinomycetota bacterium]MDA3013601.1 hypothetical protein [Actinomycetota bacterium]